MRVLVTGGAGYIGSVVTETLLAQGHDVVVNATPLGMNGGDPLPIDATRLEPGTFVGDVVLAGERTPLLKAAAARGCQVQEGLDMLLEQIPAYLDFFRLPSTTPEVLRRIARFPNE